ncbi:two pore domain potassium channel family protein [Cellulomonas sp. zg-ZUI188]|uniref:Two pore domain potassium channel family protein n=1 Tax=Cellulomonas fengjieae TaxID=2819978 RepID=A0ABS3SET7_9CELL|nr:two pore domain potassium channel family protein [Cellulomonas fengjieae]QVI67889.1 two pore domain potassium channel family protein [Cellulomonas fengjieae]
MARRTGTDDFGIVLALLVTAYVAYALSSALWVELVVLVLYLFTLGLAVRTSRPMPRQKRTVRVVLAVSAAVAAFALVALPATTADGVLDGVVCVILLTALVVILDRILRRTAVTVQSLAGALSAYLIIGMFFASVFGLMDSLTPGPFFASGEAANARSFQYFSYTTLTTLGYGDYTAAQFPGRSIATFEALVGQVFLAVLVARLVAAFHGRGEAVLPGNHE